VATDIELHVQGIVPVGQLPPLPWRQAPGLGRVIEALTSEGAQIRFVGGCVRDSLAGREVKDVDIASTALPEATLKSLETAGIKAIPTGLKHGTVTAVADGIPYEITTLRKDVETDGRHAVVAYTDNWIEDAGRRDFTFNALSCTVDGEVYDPFCGMDDLAEGRVRFVGRASQRIDEDVLRILRFFRFYAHYGRGKPDTEALAACRARAPKLAELSGERVRTELFKLLEAQEPTTALTYMKEAALNVILPEAGGFGCLRSLIWLETSAIRYNTVSPSPLRRLAALLREGQKTSVDQIADRLRLSNQERARLAVALEPAIEITHGLNEGERRAALYVLGSSGVRDITLLNWAKEVAMRAKLPRPETDGWIALIEDAENTPPPTFPLKGRDAEGLGVKAGPEMGRLLKAVENWWVQQGCPDDKEACLTELRRIWGKDYDNT